MPNSVLIVDDEPHVRVYLKNLLQRGGFPPPMQATDGEEAVSMATEHRPRLILLDINMPRMDGLTALRHLRAQVPESSVIMLTAQATESTVRECLQAGAAGFIRKDTPAGEIAASIKELAGNLTDGEEMP